MNFHIVTLFPHMFDSYLGESILARAIKERKISVKFYNPRLSVTGKYKKVWPDGNVSLQVDDRPYAGGPGMIMRAEPVIKCVEKILKKIHTPHPQSLSLKSRGKKMRIPKILTINFVPSAEKFTTASAKSFAKKYTDIILICGRYEGIDARVDKILKTTKISIGDYVLTGGEIPAMVLVDSISRQIEGVLGNFDSREEERVSSSEVYTRPEILIHNKKKYKVPEVLLSGDHKKITEWKSKQKS
jgi:tRNA (guanine37-N1)-methyltransferase